jgi:hypothetical protein
MWKYLGGAGILILDILGGGGSVSVFLRSKLDRSKAPLWQPAI